MLTYNTNIYKLKKNLYFRCFKFNNFIYTNYLAVVCLVNKLSVVITKIMIKNANVIKSIELVFEK